MSERTMEVHRKFWKGPSLRLAARAMHRQARKRFGKVPYPPKSVRLEDLPKYREWFLKIINLYLDTPADTFTRWELKADDRMIDALIHAEECEEAMKKAHEGDLIDQADLDPYGYLTYGIGSPDDFVCLDWGRADDDSFVFLSVVNSETGSFIDRFGFEGDVPPEQAVRVAISMCDSAYEWCWEAGGSIEIDERGWNYAAYRFVEDVKRAVGDTETVNPFPCKEDKD